MNKYKQLSKVVVNQAIICFVIVLVFGGIYYFTGTMVDSAIEKKTTAESSLTKDQNQITSLTNQLDKSSVAEKKFLTLQSARDTIDFSVNSDALKDWLRNAKAQYRLSNTFKLSLTSAETSTNPEFNGMNYEVIEHPAMKLEFTAMSDTHAFSFLDAFMRNAPGFIRIDSISMKRLGDIDSNTVAQARAGSAPYLVETKLEFNWIGLKEKAAPKDNDGKDGATPAAAGGAN